jgi:hypothetical protein
MSDKVELIAAAQINAFGGASPGIEFKANFGFKTATRASDGDYSLTLKHKHDPNKLVVNVTRNNVLNGDIQASLPNGETVQINNFEDTDTGSGPLDTPFFITVYLVRD